MSTIIDSIELVTNTVQMDMQLTLKQQKLPRNQIRRILHKIRNGRHFEEKQQPYVAGLKTIFETQFRPVKIDDKIQEIMSWENFTFLWDVHPVNFLMVVIPNEWVNAGGKFIDLVKNGATIHEPTAFTQQAI